MPWVTGTMWRRTAACGEVANRQLTLSYGATGTQTVNDTVLNWRNVAPAGTEPLNPYGHPGST